MSQAHAPDGEGLGPHGAQTLAEGITALGLELDATVQARLLAFGRLLLKWNRVYNLTALRTPEEVLTHHLLDSLAVIPCVQPFQHMLDVGSGAGLPGCVLALARPDWAIHSVDAVQKKISFQQQACIDLKPAQFVPIHARIETLRLPFPVDALISRAFASIEDFIRLAGPLLVPGGHLYAMKGALPQAELDRLPHGWALEAITPLTVPGLQAQRHLIRLKKEALPS